MFFVFLEPGSLEEHIRAKTDRAETWTHNLSVESVSLAEEMIKYGDIKLVDVVDVYRNVPLKLLKFAEWYTSSILIS